MTTLFISDLHLDASRPAVTDGFIAWLGRQAGQAEALYILGDLFEAWIGDDDTAPLCQQVSDALHDCVEAGTPIMLMHGNRDFLIGEQFLRASACQLITDPAIIDLYGRRTLIMHGDLLCSDDHEYQALRNTVRDPAWQQALLAKPLEARRKLARQMRSESRRSITGKSDDIMDVNPDTVTEFMTQFETDLLIHGHTHRPAIHQAGTATRIVLGDWYEQGSVLRVTQDGQFLLDAL